MTYSAFNLIKFLGVIRVSGADRTEFLHNQLSNDIKHLASAQACLASYNNAKGRVIANMLVLNTGDDLLIITAQDLCDVLVKKLRLYVLRSQVSLETVPDYQVAISTPTIPDSACNSYSATPILQFAAVLDHHHWLITLPDQTRWLIGTPQTALAADATAWQQYEINHGYAWLSQATSQTCVAQMLNQQLIGAVNFKKGCYPGQEVIARAQYRGQVKRGLAALNSQQPCNDGDIIYNQLNEEVGLIINHQANTALAVIKHSAKDQLLHTADDNGLNLKNCFFATKSTDKDK